MRIKINLMLGFWVIFYSSLGYAFEVPTFFASNMVVQQNKQFVIWGTDTAKQRITMTTSWGGSTSTRADANGKWRLTVDTPKADHKPHKIVLTGSNKKIFSNVLLGEVWFASGQSNMGMPLSGNFNQPIIGSNETILHSTNPQLRLFTAAIKASVTPLDNVQGTWQEAQPATVKTFSATAYYFAAKLQALLDVPVGIIVSAWGGTPVESWIDAPTLAQYADFNFHQALTNQPVHRQPSQLFNGMINPFLGLQIKGAIWYQGEANRSRAREYKTLFPAMVKNWRNLWNSGEFAFHFVQIAPFSYKGDRSSAYLREAQLQSVEAIPNSGMAVTLDVGNCSQIHPADKQPVGERLAYLALGNQYGMDVSHTAPTFKHADMLDDGKVSVDFANAPLGLTSFSKAITEFEVAGNDRVFFPAQAKLMHRKAKLTVWSDEVKQPVAVRYAFKDCPSGELFGVNGLPISSFRSDDW
ncbi:sialate O-acetylesterase [Paraglaciecola aquimarina]|uniref:Sialate O-acetylesterase n=1 Tax=Paraglaciecola aquimarina TaxID=1235557 RepID=A0ABU3SX28_9ALTE|nr:sialate O-acetylesterase [Paraglaciecola aquimarina]MDU0354551.1 sialate O-acetylesterase [Paraglaciecola aquimarina]